MFATGPLAPGNKISTLDELERPLGKHGHDPGIKRGTDLIDDGRKVKILMRLPYGRNVATRQAVHGSAP